MADDRPSKASDDPQASSIKNAVDRASSKTPLDSDEHIDPKLTRDRVLEKRNAENARSPGSVDPPDNPNVGPGPVKARVNRSDKSASMPETPTDYTDALNELPEQTVKQNL